MYDTHAQIKEQTLMLYTCIVKKIHVYKLQWSRLYNLAATEFTGSTDHSSIFRMSTKRDTIEVTVH